MTTVRSVCPLNCPDCCNFLVEVLGDKIKVHGDMQTMGVRGFICPKGRALADMVHSPDRLKYPLLKKNQQWHRVSWDDAYTIIEEKIRQTIQSAGPKAILHMFDYGHNGMLRRLDQRFFQALGGVTEPRGSMCWGAGIEAQKKDFGAVYSSDWEELLHSKTIILWGRDPAVTNKHLIPLLRQASENGTYIMVINPLKVKSSAFANEFIQVNPGTDGVLALGISHVILRERWMDFDFVKDHAAHFGPYAALIKDYPPSIVSAITGVSEENIERIARRVTQNRPVMFYLGYGLQRYINGFNTIRAIDALGIISGNIGTQGAGVFYAHQYHQDNLNTVLLPQEMYTTRTFPHATIAYELLKDDIEPKIQLAFVTRNNPMVSEPDSIKWRELWHNIPFKITLDMWMSQTAFMSDLILPITTIFEEEDIVATSWSNRINYAQQAIEPQGEAKPEPMIFTELAQRLGIGEFFPYTPTEWINYIIEPLRKVGITLEDLKKGSIRAPYIPQTAWEDKKFLTPSGKAELLTKDELLLTNEVNSSPAEKFFEMMALNKLIKENNPRALTNDKETRKTNTENVIYLDDYRPIIVKDNNVTSAYNYILITPHPDMAMHSQFQTEEGFMVFLHPETAALHDIQQGDRVIVESESGQIIATAYISEEVHKQVIVIPEGTTEQYLGVNCLTTGKMCLMGESTAYYDTFCQIRKWELD